jgi:hypothetical protein
MARGARNTAAGRRAASRGADAAGKLPVCSVAPAITGTPTEGEALTCSNGTWTKSPTFARQWLRDGVAIIGATASTRVLTDDDVGAVMSCTVKATNAGVSAVRTSAATAAVEAAE